MLSAGQHPEDSPSRGRPTLRAARRVVDMAEDPARREFPRDPGGLPYPGGDSGLGQCMEWGRALLEVWIEGRSLLHSLKNPLAGVIGAVQVVMEDLEPGDRLRDLMGEMLAQLDRVNDIVNDFAAIVKALEPSMERIHLDQAAARLAEAARLQLGIQMESRLGAPGTHCQLSEGLLFLGMWYISEQRGGCSRGSIATIRRGKEAILTLSLPQGAPRGGERGRMVPRESFEKAFQETFHRRGAQAVFLGPPGQRRGFEIIFPIPGED